MNDAIAAYRHAWRTFKADLQLTDNWLVSLPDVRKFLGTHQPFVVLESPFAGPTQADIDTNIAYARAAFNDALMNFGEIPFASHIKYTQPGLLDDTIPWERALGVGAGLVEGLLGKCTVMYVDRGISSGMIAGAKAAQEAGRPVLLRTLAAYSNADHTLQGALRTLHEAGVTAHADSAA